MVFKTLEEPKGENIQQIQLYLYYFQIPKGILLYVNKDNLELKEYIFDYDSSIAESLLENLTNLKSQIDTDIVPPRLTDYPGNWQCRYCQYKDICSLGSQGEMNWKEFKKAVQNC